MCLHWGPERRKTRGRYPQRAHEGLLFGVPWVVAPGSLDRPALTVGALNKIHLLFGRGSAVP